MNTDSYVNTGRCFLSAKHISVSEEWLEACVTFLSSEVGIVQLKNPSWLKSRIFEQWLHSDLRELGSKCLPLGLKNEKVTRICGHFALQINHIRDIGFPAYSQYKKLKNSENENMHVSADLPYQPAWEPKPTRMFMMELTDGTSVIQAIEYQPIPCLSLMIKPGLKVVVSGDLEVRRGVLLMKKNNLSILGGDVDTLAVPNAQENILCRMLGLPETDAPIVVSRNLSLQPTQGSANEDSLSTQQSQFFSSSSGFSLNKQTAKTAVKPSNAILPEKGEPDDDIFVSDEIDKVIATCSSRAPPDMGRSRASGRPETDVGLEEYDPWLDEEFENLSCVLDVEQNADQVIAPSERGECRSMLPWPARNNTPIVQRNSVVSTAWSVNQSGTEHRGNFTREANVVPSHVSQQNNLTKLSLSSSPFTYVCLLPQDSLQPVKATVKGFIMTLLSKMEQTVNGWSLKVLINDGTGSLEAFLSDAVLQNLIGLSVHETSQMKREAHGNPAIKAKLSECFMKCQNQLITLSCLMELTILPGKKHITISALAPVTETTKYQLQNRQTAS